MSKENVTKEGMVVRPGQIWRDLDPRSLLGERLIRVERVCGGYAYVVSNRGKKSRISIQRMHRHSTGYERLSRLPVNSKAF